MRECVKNGLAILGGGIILVTIGLSISIFWNWLRDQLSMAIYKYKRKHRFDRKPIAKCYCKDCIHNSYSAYPGCSLNNHKYVEDDFFCKKAEPRKHDPDKKKNK